MKNTAVFNSRCDIRTVATLARYFTTQIGPLTTSKLISMALETLQDIIIQTHPEYGFDSISEADEFLRSSNIHLSKRNIKTLAKALHQEHQAKFKSMNLKEKTKELINEAKGESRDKENN